MSYKVILTEAAYNDLLNIYEYMTFKGVAAYIARNLVRKIQKSILQLDEMPNRCPIYVSKSWFQKPCKCQYKFVQKVENNNVQI